MPEASDLVAEAEASDLVKQIAAALDSPEEVAEVVALLVVLVDGLASRVEALERVTKSPDAEADAGRNA